jgi:tetratricopeptide (TPR) repeat protein
MNTRARIRGVALAALLAASASVFAADDPVIESARKLLAAGNPKQAYSELIAVQSRLSGMPEFDYLLGVAALDSGHLDDAIIAFERVLAVLPNHAGAQMDLARAYYAAGSFDLAEAAFLKLKAANPPPAAQIAINRYLDAINARKLQTRAGWTAFGELGLGYDSNITGVPSNFFAASQQSIGIGFNPVGNSVKTSAWFGQAAAGAEYYYPLSRGWALFAGGEGRGRAYYKESDFNLAAAEVHFGGALNAGDDQYRISGSYSPFWQEGAAPAVAGSEKLTNDRRVGVLGFDWRHAVDTKTQVGMGVQVNTVRFPHNELEDFNEVLVSASWLHSYEGRGSPLLYLTGFLTEDRALNDFDNGVDGTSTKSKNLLGLRSYFQYSLNPKLQAFNSLGFIYRRDKDSWARSNLIERGRDTYYDLSLGLAWNFREKCALRLQYLFSHNSSNIDIYDFNRHEVSSNIRCDMI